MFFTFLRNYFVFYNCIRIFHKLSFDSSRKYLQKFFSLIFPLLLGIVTILCKNYLTWGIVILPFSILCIIFCSHSSNPKLAFSKLLISLSISYCLFTLSASLVTCFILVPIYAIKPVVKRPFIIIICILHCLFTNFLCNYKRFQHGMPFLLKKNFFNLGTLLGFTILVIYTFTQFPRSDRRVYRALLVGSLLLILYILIHWWQSQLTKSYQKYLRELELESMRTELQQNATRIKELEKKNEELGRLIHKDNKLIPAMEHAVSEYLSSGSSDAGFLSQGQALLTELKELAETRKGILDTLSSSSTASFQTGIPALNIMLSYMSERARANNISFSCTIIPEALNALPVNLPSDKLSHLLSDLLENSIIACSYATVKQIQLQIYQTRGFFTVEISDSGIPFEIPTLISFGLKKASTHLDHGGSGIGLMDIWKIKEETHASIHIHEYETASPFSKKIYLVFDKKNKYIIHTWRDQEIVPLINRNDLILFSASESFT